MARKQYHSTVLNQWKDTTMLQSSGLQALVEHRDNKISVKVRGPSGSKRACFYFLEEILGIVDQVLLEMSPGLPVDKIILSSKDLRNHAAPAQWSPRDVMKTMIKDGWSGSLTHPTQRDTRETLSQLLCFDSDQVTSSLVPGHQIHISGMSTVTRQSLCTLLDPAHQMGRDWCMLAVQMGLSDKVPKLDIGAGNYSQTARLLDEWSHHETSTIGQYFSSFLIY